MKRQIILLLVLSAGLLGCSSDGESDKIKVAFIGPLTGGVSANGLGGRNSADLAVRLHNEKENRNYTYELQSLDDECKPNVGVQVATKVAADNHIIGAVTHYCSAVAIGTVDVYHKFGLPVIVWGAVLPEITYGNSYPEIHRVNGTMINQNDVAARFMTQRGYRRWAIIHDTTDYGKGHNEYFTQSLKKYGGQIVGRFGVTADQQDFNAELTKIKNMNPEVIYFGGVTPIGVRIRTQMQRLGLNVIFQGTSGILSDAFLEGVGDLAEGVLSFREGDKAERLPGGAMFLEAYEAANYDVPPEAYGPFAFAAMNLLLEAVETVGPDRGKVTEYLNQTKNHDSIVGPITFDANGQNMVPRITKFVAQDGEWVIWEDSEYANGKRQLVRSQ